MAELILSDVDKAVLERLKQMATAHGRTAEVEAKEILTQAIQASSADPWRAIDAIRDRLAATGATFSDSTELIREDRRR